MAKFFAITIIVIAILSAIPILRHTWVAPEDISTHGALIDDQMSETMAEAGISFLAAQFVLAIFIWMFSNRATDAKIKSFPGGAKALVIAALLLVGAEVLALGVFGVKAWANVYLTAPSADAMPIQVQAGQFAFYFRYPGPDGTFGPLHPELISEGSQNFFGLDTEHDADSFFVRELRVQQDFVPGLDVSLHFTATKAGRYEIVCTQLCGLGHYNMKAYLNVLSQDDFNDWLKKQAALQ